MGKADRLYRGNDDTVAGRPQPGADAGLVRHILYLGGRGRESPYLSASIAPDVAAHFGLLWETSPDEVTKSGARHLDHHALLVALKRNHGRARWPSAKERQRAQQYVERHVEHLIDYTPLADAMSALDAVDAAFRRSR